jgi:uncharacterized membrane protein
MNYKELFSFDIKWNIKTITLLSFLAVLPNLFGMINIETPFGFKIHIFQYVIFIAAAIYGPFGGLVSGGFGSFFSAMTMHNPYIVIGNMILGFFAGWFFKRGFNLLTGALLAYVIQIPWLFVSDVYLAKMPIDIVGSIIIGLLVSNVIWALFAHYTYKPLKDSTIE